MGKYKYYNDFLVQFDERIIVNKLDGSDYPIYTGDTVVTPRVEDQILETANTTMLSDIYILKIPISDVSNSSGGITITIG